MGKLKLSHIAEDMKGDSNRRRSRVKPKTDETTGSQSQSQPQSQSQSQPKPRSRSQPQPQPQPSRFGSLMEGNPFKVAGEEVRRRKRRVAAKSNTGVCENRAEPTNPVSTDDIHISRRTDEPGSQIKSKHSRQRVTQLDLKEDTLFPELNVIIPTPSVHQQSKSQPHPQPHTDGRGCWERSGIDVINMSKQPKESTSESSKSRLEPVRPGWVRLSKDGCEYGPRSENYERIMELQMQTRYMLHREFYARSRRMMSDGYDVYGDDKYGNTAMSDDEMKSDCGDFDCDGRGSDDDDDGYSDDEC